MDYVQCALACKPSQHLVWQMHTPQNQALTRHRFVTLV